MAGMAVGKTLQVSLAEPIAPLERRRNWNGCFSPFCLSKQSFRIVRRTEPRQASSR
jgi:hypothetical protein